MTCAACGHGNREGARFCDACGATLPVPACAGCGTELRPGARFCDHCGMPVAGPRETVRVPAAPGVGDERRRITVLFADLAGSTAMQEALDPEAVRRLMGRWSTAMRAAVERHDGVIDHFAGDGIVATWGVGSVREDDAVRGVAAAWEMRTALATINDELEARFGLRLRMRTGVHTGDVVVSSEGFLVGDTMNTAARLEQNAPENEILVGRATYLLVRDHAELEPTEPVAAKGKREPVPAWRVTGLHAARPAPAVPFVGRAAEVARLDAALAATTAARAARLLTVIGSPGLGKSRLADEFTRGLGGRARVTRAACPAYGAGRTYAPVAELVRDLAGIRDGDDVSARLTAAAGADAERVVAGLAGVLGAGPQTPAQETFWAVRTLLEHAAAEHPVVVVLEDLHWAEPQFLDLVEHLEARLTASPVLLLALARPDLRETRERLTRAAIELAPLGPGEGEQIVGAVGGGRLPAETLRVAAGNPLFLTELARMAVDGDQLSVPPTITALMTARLRQLPDAERTVVERAAVVGREFSRGALVELAPAGTALHLDADIERLRRREVIDSEGAYWYDDPVYAFHHVLIRDAAYDALLKETRAALHERYADWLDARPAGPNGDTDELVAFHLERAHEYRRAISDDADAVRRLGDAAAERLARSGRRALARDDFAAAAALLGRSAACASAPGALVHFDRVTALLGAGDFDAARAEVAALEALREADPSARAAADVAAVATGYLARGLNRDDLAVLDRAIAEARMRDEPRTLAHALHWKGTFTVLYEGRHADGGALLEEALRCARSVGDERLVADVLTLLALVALWGPLPLDAARERCELIMTRLRERPGSRKMEAQTQCVLGLLAAMEGRVEESRAVLAQARAVFADLELALDVVDADLFAARAELLNGDRAAAAAHARAALAGPGGLGPSGSALLALAIASDDPAAAVALADEVLAAVEPANLRPYVGAAGVRARAWSADGRHADAVALAQAAVAAAERTDAAVQRAEALELLADVLAAACDPEADEIRQSALGAYEAKGHRVGAQRLAAAF